MIDCSLLKPVDVSTSIIKHRQRIVRNIELGRQIAQEHTHKTQEKMKHIMTVSQLPQVLQLVTGIPPKPVRV